MPGNTTHELNFDTHCQTPCYIVYCIFLELFPAVDIVCFNLFPCVLAGVRTSIIHANLSDSQKNEFNVHETSAAE